MRSGVMYGKGEGVAKDDAEAFKWYLRAAERGLPAAQQIVGVRYYNGTGVKQDSHVRIRVVADSLGARQQGGAAFGRSHRKPPSRRRRSRRSKRSRRAARQSNYKSCKP
jgi:TPR repeat protein